VPLVPSILPLPLLGGPDDPEERVDALCASLHRLAPFRPSGVVCLTGTGLGRDPDDARGTVVAGLRTLGAEAASLGLRIAVEPYQRDGGEEWTIAGTIPEALELIRDAGDAPSLALQFDLWHLWNTPSLHDDVEQHVTRLAGVHVADHREPTRGWADRVLPGDGDAHVADILAALDDAGWDGFYDLEIFSDDGTFGSSYPDSYWALPVDDAARLGVAAVRAALPSTTPARPDPRVLSPHVRRAPAAADQ
jgi:sugar phosphate isomerase/epimerase